MFDRAGGWDFKPAGPGFGAGLNGAAANAAGTGLTGSPPVVPLGLTHRIYPDGHAVTVIRGELDAATADQAYDYVRQVIDRSRGPVRIDLAGLTFCDARGLRTLVGVAAHARKAGRRLSLVAPRPAIVKIMRITGVDANFPELCPPGSPVSRP